jgi:hypothetical protein
VSEVDDPLVLALGEGKLENNKMEIRPTKRPGYEAKLVFSGLDIKVMSAMAKERMHNLAMNKELQDATEADIEIARWEKRKIRRTLYVADLSEVAERLTEFGEDTDEVVEEIPDVTLTPAYANEHIPYRTQLGRHAVQLAAQLKDEEVSRFANGDMDKAAASLLTDSSTDPE